MRIPTRQDERRVGEEASTGAGRGNWKQTGQRARGSVRVIRSGEAGSRCGREGEGEGQTGVQPVGMAGRTGDS